MSRFSPRRPPAAPVQVAPPVLAATEAVPLEEENSRASKTGFRVAFAVWAMGFLFLLLFEIGGFLLKVLRQLF
jgi:hypothetical protein